MQHASQAINGIMLLFTVIPGIGYLITAGVVRLIKVDRKLMHTIQGDLALRRENFQELPTLRQRDGVATQTGELK